MGSYCSIAITGGPCAGKTSALEAVRAALASESVPCIIVPEAATTLILSGVSPTTCTSMLEFQTRVIALQLQREAAALAKAESLDRRAVVVCDRGLCDSRAYLSAAEYGRALEENGTDAEAALSRYDAVFHLQSVAAADPGTYTRANNGARLEDAAEAALADERTLEAWSGHGNVTVIGCETGFEAKAAKLIAAVMSHVIPASASVAPPLSHPRQA